MKLPKEIIQFEPGTVLKIRSKNPPGWNFKTTGEQAWAILIVHGIVVSEAYRKEDKKTKYSYAIKVIQHGYLQDCSNMTQMYCYFLHNKIYDYEVLGKTEVGKELFT
jgi:hypothetical protein